MCNYSKVKRPLTWHDVSNTLRSFICLSPLSTALVSVYLCHFHCLCRLHAGSEVERLDQLRFLSRCRKKRLNQAVSVLSPSIGFVSVLLLFITGPSFEFVSLRWYVFCLLVFLVHLSVLAKWWARKTPLMTPFCGEIIVHFPGGPGLASVYWSKGWWKWWWQLQSSSQIIACLCWKCHWIPMNLSLCPSVSTVITSLVTIIRSIFNSLYTPCFIKTIHI